MAKFRKSFFISRDLVFRYAIIILFCSFLLNCSLAQAKENQPALHHEEWIEKLTEVNSSNTYKPCCTNEEKLTFAGKESSVKSGTCPAPLIKLVQDDPKSSLFGLLPSYEKSCSVLIQDKIDVAPSELLSFIQTQKSQPGVNYNLLLDKRGNANLKACAESLPKREGNLTISKSLFLNNKLNLASDAHLTEIAAIESLLADKKLSSTCQKLATSAMQIRCSQHALACNKQSLEELAKHTEKLFGEVQSIKRELARTKDKVKRMKLENRLQTLHEVAPWLKGKKFNRLKLAGLRTDLAIKKQLEENRDLLVADLLAFSSAQKCLNGDDSHNCKPKELRETLAKSLFIQNNNEMVLSDLKSKMRLANHSLRQYEACLLDGKIDQDRTADVITSAGISAAISLATVGGGAIVAAARSSALVKDIAQVGIVGVQSHIFVTDMENTVKSCFHKATGLEKELRLAPLAGQIKCTNITQNLSQATEFDGCFQNGLMAAMSVASLGVVKAQVLRETKMQRLSEWEPSSEADLKRYFYVHQLEVRKNAKNLVAQNQEIFSEVAPRHLKTLKNHDLEKFLSFKSLSTNYHYKGVPKEIIDGLEDAASYKGLISADGKYVEMSVSRSLYLLWGSSPQSVVEKIKAAKTAEERLHWESILKLRNHVVSEMATIDDKIMGSVYSQITSPRGRVEMKLVELLSDLTARSANPITKTEMGRPISKASEFLQKMGGEGITSKIADSASPQEIEEAKKLVKEIGVEQIQKMADSLEASYRSAGMPNSFKTTVLAMFFEKRKGN